MKHLLHNFIPTSFIIPLLASVFLVATIFIGVLPPQATYANPVECTASLGTWDETTEQCVSCPEGSTSNGELCVLNSSENPNESPATTPGATNNTSNEDDSTLEVEQTTTCERSFFGIGWAMCQIARMVYGLFDWLLNNVLAEHLLEIDLIDENEELYRVWANFKFLANLLFAIVFFVIIYAEASGRVGALETFSVTRLLPRLAFAVIGLQLSYFIVGYTIALFNDLGSGVAGLVLLPVDGLSQFEFKGLFQPFTENGTFWGIPTGTAGDAVDGLVIGLISIGAAGIGAYLLLSTGILFGALGLLLLLFTLVARRLLIVALVILSPIAFALFVLPSTEKYFRQWWDIFLKTLLMYPLIMVFIASGSLLGRLAIAGEDITLFDSIIGMIATFLPFFIIPVTFRLAGTAIASVASGIRGVEDKIKGDIRDPNSVRSHLRRTRGQRYGRLMGGQTRIPGTSTAIIPAGIRRAYNRIPGVDTSASLMADIIAGRKARDELTSTLGDDIIRAAAVTGGGAKKGQRVGVEGGGYMRSGYLKFGKHFAYDDNGYLITRNGIAQLLNADGSLSSAKAGDFYDRDTMSQVRKYSTNRGFLHASAEYAMTKTTNENDQAQVWSGLDASRWTADEKSTIANSVWYSTKNDHLHNKFGDFAGYFHDGSYDVPGDNRRMNVKFDKAIDYIDEKIGSYELSKQQGPFWQNMTRGLEDFAASKDLQPDMTEAEYRAAIQQQYDQINNLAWKAQAILNTTRSQRVMRPGDGDDGPTGEMMEQMSGSQAVGAAARGAEEFLKVYRRVFGKLPPTSRIEDQIRPNGD